MDPVVRIQVLGSRHRDRVARGYRWALAQPSWIARVALLAFLLVVGVPIMLLVGLAVLAAVIVFAGLALLHTVINRMRGLPAAGDGRDNVRVIRRQ